MTFQRFIALIQYRGEDMTTTLILIIKCLSAILAGIFQGNGAVFLFNKMPAEWLCEYDEKPCEELLDPYTQRVKSYPWKYIFTMFFVVLNIRLVTDDIQFAVAASCVIWLLLEIAIADIKYRIIPDQLVLLLAVSALGFVTFHSDYRECLWGGLCGLGVMLMVAVLGKITSRREAIGGGDIKLFASLGLICGLYGILAVFVLTTLISGAHLVALMLMRKKKPGDTVAMGPYIAVATGVYLVFLWGYEQILYI